MSDILFVTNRKLCRKYARPSDAAGKEDIPSVNTADGNAVTIPEEREFLYRIEQLARCHPAGILLREKDLSEAEYEELARQVLQICKRFGTPCILHGVPDAALALRADAVHLPLGVLRGLSSEKKNRFRILGASCHSAKDAREAQDLGCTYITVGHIFATDCKAGLPGRGTIFLREVCESVRLPVFAIGGICRENIVDVRRAGAAGACVMSGCMLCEDAAEYLSGIGKRQESPLWLHGAEPLQHVRGKGKFE